MSGYLNAAVERRADEFKERLASQVRACYSKRISSGSSDPCRFNIALLPTEAQERAGRLRAVGFDPTLDDDRRAMELAIRLITSEVDADITRSPYGAPKSFKVASFDVIRWAYSAVGEIPPEQRDERGIAEILKDASQLCRIDWCASYLSDPSAIDSCKDVDEARSLARLLATYSKVGKPVWLRSLSIIAFSDSKALENHGWDSRLVGAAESQGAIPRGLSQRDALRALGLLTNPSSRLIGGTPTLDLEGRSIDLRAFGSGLRLDEDLAREVIDVRDGHALLEVENLACFYDLCRDPVPGVLIVYGGGYSANALETSSFTAIVEMFERSAPVDSICLAWSDIDHGGFDITRSLIRRFPRFRPFLMDVQTIESIDRGLLLGRSEDYIEDYLRPVLLDEGFRDFHAVCSRCIEMKATLEQEVLLMGRVQRELRSLIG